MRRRDLIRDSTHSVSSRGASAIQAHPTCPDQGRSEAAVADGLSCSLVQIASLGERDGWQVVETGQRTLAVVGHFEAFAECALYLLACRESMMIDQVSFQGSPKRLNRHVAK